MGLKTIKIGAREAVELACDNVAHRGEQPMAWFDCGSELGNLTLAMAAGWERRNANAMWLCPRCAQQDLKRDGAHIRADEALALVKRYYSPRAAMRDGVTRLRTMRPEYRRPDQTNGLVQG